MVSRLDSVLAGPPPSTKKKGTKQKEDVDMFALEESASEHSDEGETTAEEMEESEVEATAENEDLPGLFFGGDEDDAELAAWEETEGAEEPATKRKASTRTTRRRRKKEASRIFAPFRTIGHVTSAVPSVVQQRGQETYLTVAAANTFQIYNCSKLQLQFVGAALPTQVTALAVYKNKTFAAFGSTIVVYYRGKQTDLLEQHHTTEPIVAMEVFGETLVAQYGKHVLLTWHTESLRILFCSNCQKQSFTKETLL